MSAARAAVDVTLPFFAAHHVSVARAFERWVGEEIAPLEHTGDDWLTRYRRCLARLGASGWLSQWYAGRERGQIEGPRPSTAPSAQGRLDTRTLCLMREVLARVSDLGDFAFAIQGLGSLPILLAGDEALKARYLPPTERAQEVAAFAISEPQAGSDLSTVSTEAVLDGDRYLVSGCKTWISNATNADYFVVLARTQPAAGPLGLSLLVVDRAAGGVTSEPIALGAPRPFGTVRFTRAPVPRAHLVGRPGRGLQVVVSALEIARPTVGAAALGLARRALDEALAWCETRRIGAAPLASLPLTQHKLAEMMTLWQAARLLVYRGAWALDTNSAPRPGAAAMAKWYATEVAQQIVDQAIQLMGAAGLVADSPLERLYRQVRSLRIYEGTTEIQKLTIAAELVRAAPPSHTEPTS